MQIYPLCIVVFLLLSGCDSEAPATGEELTKKVRPVKLLSIGAEETENLLNYPAVIEAAKSSSLAFQESGELIELFVNELQMVKQGEVLARLDQRDFQTKRNSALTQYKNADSEYQRAVNLYKEDAISKSILEQRKTQRDVNKSLLESAEKSLENTTLIAPFAGIVAAVAIKERELIQAGQAAIVIQGIKGLEAKINLPASVITTAGKNNNQKGNEFVTLGAAPDRRIPATFKEVSLQADAASQTYLATFTFSAPEDLTILPGMNATVWFKDPSTSNNRGTNISIPLSAIGTENDQKFVWLVNQSTMNVSRRNIVVEVGVGENLNVVSGLQQGDLIVASGVSYLSEGMKVRPWLQ